MKHTLIWSLIIVSNNLLFSQNDDNIKDADHTSYELELIYDQVKIPWSIEFIDENTIIFSEKEGKIFILNDYKTREVTGVPEVYMRGQGGLLDLELHPEFNKNKWLYMSYAAGSKGEGGGHTAIGRGQLIGNKLQNFEVLYKGEGNTTKGQHFGSRLQFDKNGYLFFSIGDRGNRDQNPQDLNRDGGKIYRIHDDGRIPKNNPFVNKKGAKTAIFFYWHRNPQGMFLHPDTGAIWTHEHGPKGGDEINIIEAEKNYGWPKITYGVNYIGTTITKDKALPGLEQPLYYWIPSIAPSGFALNYNEHYPNWKGNLFVGSLKFQYLERLVLDDNLKVSYREKIAPDIGRVRDVKLSPEGYIYMAVEQKGIYKIIPKQ